MVDRRTLALYRLQARVVRPGRPPKTPPRELVLTLENLAPETVDPLVETFKPGLAPGAVLEVDGEPVAWGPKLADSAREVGASYVAPVEVVRESPPMPVDGAHPVEVARFSIDVAWDTYHRSIGEMDDLLNRNRRMVAQSISQCEHFVTATQRLMELEAEMTAIRAEEKVREAEAERQRQQPPPPPPNGGSRFTMDDLMGMLKTIADSMRPH